jgi:hypothetical protein
LFCIQVHLTTYTRDHTGTEIHDAQCRHWLAQSFKLKGSWPNEQVFLKVPGFCESQCWEMSKAPCISVDPIASHGCQSSVRVRETRRRRPPTRARLPVSYLVLRSTLTGPGNRLTRLLPPASALLSFSCSILFTLPPALPGQDKRYGFHSAREWRRVARADGV